MTRLRPAALSGRGERVEQMAVGGEREVERLAGEGAQAASSWTSSTRPRRSRGSPPVSRTLVMPRPTKSSIRRRYSSMPSSGYCAPDLAGAAVDALVVAAVGDGDAQIVDDAAVAVGRAGVRASSGSAIEGSSGHRQPSRLYRFAGRCARRSIELASRWRGCEGYRAASVDARCSPAQNEAGDAEARR